MKFIDEQKTEILSVLYDIYDNWQTFLKRAMEKGDSVLIEQYENSLDKILDFIEKFKESGEIDIPRIHLWSICIHAIQHGEDGE